MNGKVIIVTGGFGALGRSVAARLATAGATVALIDFAARVPAELGAQYFALAGVDLAQPADAERAVARIVERCGRIDGLANIAGGFHWQTISEGQAADWDAMYRINLSTALNASRAVLPHLRSQRSGRIVNIGAYGALRAATGMGAYAASKAAVHRLTEALAEELKPEGIGVNAVLPTIIDTPRNRSDMPQADFARWVAPDDLAAVIGFLLSDAARAVTGALIPVVGRV